MTDPLHGRGKLINALPQQGYVEFTVRVPNTDPIACVPALALWEKWEMELMLIPPPAKGKPS